MPQGPEVAAEVAPEVAPEVAAEVAAELLAWQIVTGGNKAAPK